MTNTEITPEDWISAGYKRFSHVSHVRSYASFGLQKLFSDDKGKRYYLTVFVYDNRKYERNTYMQMPDYTFEPDLQFTFDDKPTINISMGLTGSNWSIAGVEQQVEELWAVVGMPYYESFQYD